MLSLIEQIKTGSLWNFPGGVHPPENKAQSNQNGIVRAQIPDEIVLPVKQHIGKPGDLLVKAGDYVLKGQPLTKYSMSFMLPIHAPTSGTISAIEPRTTAHPSGLSDTCIVITPDGNDKWCAINPTPDFTASKPDELIESIRQAGISGMGGAGFPTAKKIQSGLTKTDLLIINAAECEPYITADDTLMQHYANDVITGIQIVAHILKPTLVIIGIEDNKPQAIKALEAAAKNTDIVIRVIPTKYPSGGEKQLIKILTNKEVPNTGIPADIGMLVLNVGSLYAIKKAIVDGEPLIERVVTLTGNTFKRPQNVWARIGTPVQSLLNEFGYQADKKAPRLIMGGPMMGFTLPHAYVPITKTSNCILAPTRKEIPVNHHEMECIRCSQCADACPASLLPQQLQWYAKSEDYDKCEELNLKDCIECGACAFVCPSEIPLVQYYRQAKAEIRIRKSEAEAAERAKVRFEEKNARMERDKAERENRFKKAADTRRKEMKASGSDDAIAAAIARVKAQKQTPDDQPAAIKPAVAAAIAKAKAKQAQVQSASGEQPDNTEMIKLREERKRQARERKLNKNPEDNEVSDTIDDKKASVAAAIARAKARKAQTTETQRSSTAESNSQSDSSPESAIQQDAVDPKKAAVAAAIARAKARKAQVAEPQSSSTAESDSQSDSSSDSAIQQDTVDPKKAAVAAAIARAKARKVQVAEPQRSSTAESGYQSDSSPDSAIQQDAVDPKKAAVAAAIARAKARKAQVAEPQRSSTTESGSQSDNPPKSAIQQDTVDPKKAAVAAAIARAKARKAQVAEPQSSSITESDSQSDSPQDSATQQDSVDPKKAAVAAAIARAKARKALKEQNNEENE